MMRWDKMYLDRVRRAGIVMQMYERYIDDSNQAAVVPLPGAKYDSDSKKVIIDENLIIPDENEDERLARVLKEIANDILPDIQMEEDHPSQNDDKKMPILDMKVWMDDQEGYIMYEHFEKPMASKKVMHSLSAQSASCKQSVHTQEILRRLMSSSERLDWDREVAPVISRYMARMMQAGYPELYRKNTLCKAIRIFDKMRKDDQEGTRPIYRPKDWNISARRREKRKKQHNWSTVGGHIAPIFVPPTPNGELAKAMRKVAEQEAEAGVSFRIVETGGRSVKTILQKTNPTATTGCMDTDCLPCKAGRGSGGNCRNCNVNYEVECQLCPAEERSKYIGETARNLFTRGKEHSDRYRNRSKKSFMLKHQTKKHQGMAGSYTAKVTGSSRDCLTRQVREAVMIRRCPVPVLNSKTEWHQPALWRIQNEILRG